MVAANSSKGDQAAILEGVANRAGVRQLEFRCEFTQSSQRLLYRLGVLAAASLKHNEHLFLDQGCKNSHGRVISQPRRVNQALLHHRQCIGIGSKCTVRDQALQYRADFPCPRAKRRLNRHFHTDSTLANSPTPRIASVAGYSYNML